jgi:hypothetical protein
MSLFINNKNFIFFPFILLKMSTLENSLPLLFGLGALYYIVSSSPSSNKREGFRFQQAPPTIPGVVPPLSDSLGLTQGGGLGFNQSPSLLAGGIPANASPLTAANPNFATLGALSSGQSQLLNKGNFMTTDQVKQMVGSGTPEFNAPILPNPDMKYATGVDPTNPENFIYNRTLFARLKRRYTNDVDYFRGDIDVTPEYRGWFDIRPPSDVDKVQGYFDRYIDIEQETAIRDATFDRNLSASDRKQRNTNPFGDEGKLVYSTL